MKIGNGAKRAQSSEDGIIGDGDELGIHELLHRFLEIVGAVQKIAKVIVCQKYVCGVPIGKPIGIARIQPRIGSDVWRPVEDELGVRIDRPGMRDHGIDQVDHLFGCNRTLCSRGSAVVVGQQIVEIQRVETLCQQRGGFLFHRVQPPRVVQGRQIAMATKRRILRVVRAVGVDLS